MDIGVGGVRLQRVGKRVEVIGQDVLPTMARTFAL